MAHVYVRSGAAGAATGADWTNAYTTLPAAFAGKAAGDQFWVSEDHSESASGKALTCPGTVTAPCTIRCVNHAGTVPPASADLTTGAIVASTTTGTMAFLGFGDYDGIEFRFSSAASQGLLNMVPTAAFYSRFGANTKFTCIGTSATSLIQVGTATVSIPFQTDWNGVTLKFAAVGQGIRLLGGRVTWRGGSVDAAGSAPTTLFSTGQYGHFVLIEGVDLSAITGTIVGSLASFSEIRIKDCKINAAATIAATPASPGAGRVIVSRTSATGISTAIGQYTYAGSETAQTVVVRHGGSPVAQKIVTNTNTKFLQPYEPIPLVINNRPVANTRTITIQGIANMAAIPKDDEFWIRVGYLGAATSPLASFKTGAKADILATGANLTASTVSWSDNATARADAHTYALDDAIKLASNLGRVFFCTTAGDSAASEPGTYVTAVDGDSITDGTAVFRAGWRFSQSVTLSSPAPALAGPIYIYPRVGAASVTIYLDQLVGLA